MTHKHVNRGVADRSQPGDGLIIILATFLLGVMRRWRRAPGFLIVPMKRLFLVCAFYTRLSHSHACGESDTRDILCVAREMCYLDK